jgi:hypothetical protein
MNDVDKPKGYFGKDRYRVRMWRCIEHHVTPEKSFGGIMRWGIIDNDGCWREIVEFDNGAHDWCSCPMQRFAEKWDLQSRDDSILCICGCQEEHGKVLDAENERAMERILEGRPVNPNAELPPALLQAHEIAANVRFGDCNGQHTPACVRVIYPEQ